MANKKLGTAAFELRLPTKKDKAAKKPKWQAKTGGRKAKGQGSEAHDTVPLNVSPFRPSTD